MIKEEILQLEAMAEMTVDSNEKVDLLNKLSWEMRFSNRSKAKDLANQAVSLSKELKYEGGLNYAQLHQALFGLWSADEGEFLLQVHEAINYFKSVKDFIGLVRAENIATIFYDQYAQYNKAIEHGLSSIKLARENVLNKELADCLTSTGQVYSRLQDYKKAIEAIKEGLEMRAELEDAFGMASSLNLLARNYNLSGDAEKAEEYYQKCLELREDINDVHGIPWTYLGLASFYQNNGELDKAIEYYKEGIELNTSDDKRYRLLCLLEEGRIWQQKKKPNTAIEILDEAHALAEEINITPLLADVKKEMAACFEALDKPNESLRYLKEYYALKDEILNTETRNQLKHQEIAFSVEKAEKEAEIFRLKNVELKQANEAIAYQKSLLEEKNKDITDSIEYTKHIQDAYLPSLNSIRQALPEFFLLFQPKDIVSGDFYWVYTIGLMEGSATNTVLFAAADCTGHGVPGAIMSVICCNALNEAIKNKLHKSDLILNTAREEIVKTIGQKGKQKDGMDIALCSLDKDTNILEYAGANNPLWVISKSEKLKTKSEIITHQTEPGDKFYLHEIKADRQSVGYSDENEPFSLHNVQLQKGDLVYLFSDGFADQFGGKNGKKFKYKPFKNLLLSISEEELKSQKETLKNYFTNWKKGFDQIDDVIIFCVKTQ